MARNELWAQKLMVDAAIEYGGYGEKLSHRFKVGVPDLLIKLQGRQAFIVEAKIREAPMRYLNMEWDSWGEVTPLQRKNLQAWWDAGLQSGVVLFCKLPKDELLVNIYDWPTYVTAAGVVRYVDFHKLPRTGKTDHLFQIMMEFSRVL